MNKEDKQQKMKIIVVNKMAHINIKISMNRKQIEDMFEELKYAGLLMKRKQIWQKRSIIKLSRIKQYLDSNYKRISVIIGYI